MTLEEKLEYVDHEINNLARQLQHANKVNARLKDELKQARSQKKVVKELEKKLNHQMAE